MINELIEKLKGAETLSFDNGNTFATMDIDKISKINSNIVVIGDMEDEQGQHYDYEYNINKNNIDSIELGY